MRLGELELVDAGLTELGHAVIGSGLRKSKLPVSGKLLTELPGARALKIAQV